MDKENLTSLKIVGDYFVDSRRLGDRNKDKQKYLKDGNLLIDAIENNIDPDLHGRYYFYAAQSFRDYKDLEKGKWVKVGEWQGVEVAKAEIVASVERAKK